MNKASIIFVNDHDDLMMSKGNLRYKVNESLIRLPEYDVSELNEICKKIDKTTWREPKMYE